ncbi:MAG TPA: hypothetical protein VM848_01675 [Acidimicrobiia bacterium]|nr:hypothetical protein [Acidimicrobiia bacterium]
MTDSVSKLIDVAQVMLRFEDAGVPVVAGHLGALGGVLRSLGVAAADAGLGSGETFDANRLYVCRSKEKANRQVEVQAPGVM